MDRLDEYIKKMSNLRNIKELELHIKFIESKDLLNNMKKIGKALSKEKQFKINSNLKSQNINLDENVILEVYENILTNGFRYSKNMVEVNIEEDGRIFTSGF